ncbi:MAG TPA: CoB--CoM heterodisulfide reductase iron-sulfur subunit B family protein [Anaerolineae bacterium]|nr:CoB--CoM heterodisulfide reductase iron-sulfur subunit B family protein [Anaerolineae bacterium]
MTQQIKVPYFPGCTLNTTAKGFDNALRASTRFLGLELVELPEWNCCGATFPLLVDNVLDLAGPARVLVAGRSEGERLAVACTTCYNVLRRTNLALASDGDRREKLSFFIEADLEGDLQILDVLQILRDEIGFDEIARRVTKPLAGLRAAAYYGCMVLRPPEEVAYDDPENPHVLDDLLAALGAESVDYPHKGECCGSYLAVLSPKATASMVSTVLVSAQKNGAQLMVTNCPLCQFNLDRQQAEMTSQHSDYRPIPVLYFSQLLSVALGLEAVDAGWEKHYVDPEPILAPFR